MPEPLEARVSLHVAGDNDAGVPDPASGREVCAAVLVDADLVAVRAVDLPPGEPVHVIVEAPPGATPQTLRPRAIDILQVAGEDRSSALAFIRLQERCSVRPHRAPAVIGPDTLAAPASLLAPLRLSGVAGAPQLVVPDEPDQGAPVRTFVVDPHTVASWACWLVPWCMPPEPDSP